MNKYFQKPFYKRDLFYQIIFGFFIFLFIFHSPYLASYFALPYVPHPEFRNYLYDYADFLYFFDSVAKYFHQEPQFTSLAVSGYPLYTPVFLIIFRFFSHGDLVLFFRLLQFVMFFSFIGTLYFSSRILHAIGRSESLSWFLFLPSTLFFVYSRFDMLVVFFLCACLYFLQKQKFTVSLFLLAVTILFKWFTVFLVPVFFLYTVLLLSQKSFDPIFFTRIKKAWLVFLCILFFSHIIFLFIFGTQFVLEPYLLQFNRPVEIGSFMAAFVGGPILEGDTIYQGIFSSGILTRILSFFFVILQFLPVLLFIVSEKRFDKDFFFTFLTWSALIVTSFVLFNKVYSNQWIVWFLPLLIFTLKKPADYILLVLFDVLNYIQFPVFFGFLLQGHIFLFQTIAFARSIFLLVIIVRLYMYLHDTHPFVKIHPYEKPF